MFAIQPLKRAVLTILFLAVATPMVAQGPPPACFDFCHFWAMVRYDAGMNWSDNNALFLRCIDRTC